MPVVITERVLVHAAAYMAIEISAFRKPIVEEHNREPSPSGPLRAVDRIGIDASHSFDENIRAGWQPQEMQDN